MTFLAGLLIGGIVITMTKPSAIVPATGRPLGMIAMAGLCVGMGVRMSGGCTSGHGVCGISRGSTRSVTATVTFISTGILMTWSLHGLGWGLP
jgi:hypothetical protein